MGEEIASSAVLVRPLPLALTIARVRRERSAGLCSTDVFVNGLTALRYGYRTECKRIFLTNYEETVLVHLDMADLNKAVKNLRANKAPHCVNFNVTLASDEHAGDANGRVPSWVFSRSRDDADVG